MSTEHVAAYSDALVLLGTAGVVVPLVQRLGISPVLGYLGAGAILGPLGLGSLTGTVPALFWVTVTEAANVAGIAELGVVFLLFLIGLELSFSRLSAMRRLVLGLGGLQVLLTSAVIAGVALALSHSPSESIVLGSSLSLSSTAIVLELLSTQERLTTSVGRASFSILLAQDLAVIPILLFISILAAHSGGSVLASLATALLQAAAAIVDHRRDRTCVVAPVVPVGGERALDGAFHRRGSVRHHCRRRDRPAGAAVDGARRLRRRTAAGRNRIPQGDRNDDSAVQRPAPRFLLLHRRHECRFSRALARTAFACRSGRRADCREGAAARRAGQAVPPFLAGRRRDRLAAQCRR